MKLVKPLHAPREINETLVTVKLVKQKQNKQKMHVSRDEMNETPLTCESGETVPRSSSNE